MATFNNQRFFDENGESIGSLINNPRGVTLLHSIESLKLNSDEIEILRRNNGSNLIEPLCNFDVINFMTGLMLKFNDDQTKGVFVMPHTDSETLDIMGNLLTAFLALKVVNPIRISQGMSKTDLDHSTQYGVDSHGHPKSYLNFDQTNHCFIFNTSTSEPLKDKFIEFRRACDQFQNSIR